MAAQRRQGPESLVQDTTPEKAASSQLRHLKQFMKHFTYLAADLLLSLLRQVHMCICTYTPHPARTFAKHMCLQFFYEYEISPPSHVRK